MPQSAAPTAAGRRPVCVIARQSDATADRVVMRLNEMHVPVIRFDLSDFPVEVSLDAALTDSRWNGTLTVRDNRTVRLEDIGAIMWWHPGKPEIAADVDARERVWAEKEATAGIAGVLASLDCLHINRPDRTQISQVKAMALKVAGDCGLSVPAIWIGNDPERARAFTTASPDGVVCKSLVAPWVEYLDGTVANFFTTPVTPAQLDDSLALTAHQLQDAILKAGEARVIVVGERIWAAGITAHSHAARADFRADYAALSYALVDVPEGIADGLSRLMAHYGLVYAACDFLIDRRDRWWLVDINPAGQYAWIEDELPQIDVSGAIAWLLAHPYSAVQSILQDRASRS